MVLIINYILCIRIYKSSIGFEYSLSCLVLPIDDSIGETVPS